MIMASTGIIFSSCLPDALGGRINFDTDLFGVMLVGADYKADRSAHTRRKDVTSEVKGEGYQAGGAIAKVEMNRGSDLLLITLGETTWKNASITARGAVYFKRRDGKPENQELVAYVDFGRDVTSTAGDFDLSASTIRIPN